MFFFGSWLEKAMRFPCLLSGRYLCKNKIGDCLWYILVGNQGFWRLQS